jgi:hypothetical protein
LAIASASFSVAGAAVALPNEPEKELQIKGDWPADMAESLREEIGKLRMQLLEDEIFIRDQIRTLADLLAGYTAPRGHRPVRATTRPTVAGRITPTAKTQSTNSRCLGPTWPISLSPRFPMDSASRKPEETT